MNEIFKKFSDKYNKNKDPKKIPIQDIEKLEREFQIILPQDYKSFLINYGCLHTPDILDLIVDNDLALNDVQEFWGIENIIYDKKNEWSAQIKPDLIPFALDCMGSLFGFLTSDLKEKKETVPVYFFDHDFDTVEKKSESFSNWINEFNKL